MTMILTDFPVAHCENSIADHVQVKRISALPLTAGCKEVSHPLVTSEGLEDNHLHSEDCSFKLRNSPRTSRNSHFHKHGQSKILQLSAIQFYSNSLLPLNTVLKVQQPRKKLNSCHQFFIGSLWLVLVKVTKYHIFQDFTAKLRFANLRCLEKIPKWWWFSMGSNQ